MLTFLCDFQISSLMEENNLLNETHQNAKKELQAFIATLEEQVKEHTANETSVKAELESLKAQIEENSKLYDNLKNVEEKLTAAQKTIDQQVSTQLLTIIYALQFCNSESYFVVCQELEKDAALKEVEAKKAAISELEKQIKELQAVNAKAKEQVTNSLHLYICNGN